MKEQDHMDIALSKIMRGITPQFVQLKSEQYHKEFLRLKEDKEAREGEPLDDDEMLFRSFICHKVAALNIVLEKVVELLNDEE